VNAPAMVLGIDAPLDGKDGSGITLQLMVNRRPNGGGYTPGGQIDTHTNTSGNTWELTFDAAEAVNLVCSPDITGVVTTHMRAGDLITILQLDDETPTQVEGVIDSVDGDNAITVTLDAAWTPGTDVWAVEWSLDNVTPTAYQQSFTWVADSTRLLVTGERAWLYE
jgi:hypothetical protein